MWHPSSFFLRTEFIFWRELSIIDEFEGVALVITTPENPYWRLGNLIVLTLPPKAVDYDQWRGQHSNFIGPHPSISNRLLVWEGAESPIGEFQPYLADDLTYTTMDVLKLGQLQRPSTYNSSIEQRQLGNSVRGWDDVLQLNIECFGTRSNDPMYLQYTKRRIVQYHQMVEAGMGRWYSAYLGQTLVGSLGIFFGDGLCRFQQMAVGSTFHRQGIAASIVYEAAKDALEEFPDCSQIIAADRNGDGFRIYQSLGFQKDSYSYALNERD